MATVDVIRRRAIPLTVTRPTGTETVTDGYAVKDSAAVENLTGFMAPLSPRELRYMPEGQNTLEWWHVWSESELKVGDVLSDGSAPAVTLNRMEYWKEGAFWHGQGVIVEGEELLIQKWNVPSGVYDGFSGDVSSEEFSLQTCSISSDGLILYIIGRNPQKELFQYSLQAPFNVENPVYTGKSFVTTDREGMFFKDDATYFVAGDATNTVREYSMYAAGDIETSLVTGKAFDCSSQTIGISAVCFSGDGTKFYVNGASGIFQYGMSIPWDLGTAAFEKQMTAVIHSDIQGLIMSVDGTEFYLTSFSSKKTYTYDLVIAKDVASAEYNNKELILFSQFGDTPESIFMSPHNATKLFVCGREEKIYSYTMDAV